MALFLSCPPSACLQLVKSTPYNRKLWLTPSENSRSRKTFEAKACFFNPSEEPLLKEALKEPVAFMGGVFAGLLRLDLNEDPLKEWVTRTVEASGISEAETYAQNSSAQQEEEGSPQQIEIE